MGQSSEKGTQNVLYLKSRYSNVGLKAKMEDDTLKLMKLNSE